MFPSVRCKVCDEIVAEVRIKTTECDHDDADRTNNSPSNFRFLHRLCNQLKNILTYPQLKELAKKAYDTIKKNET